MASITSTEGLAPVFSALSSEELTALPMCSHPIVETVPLWQEALQSAAFLTRPILLTKSAFLKPKKGSSLIFVLSAVTDDDRPINLKVIGQATGFGSGSLRFADATTLQTILGPQTCKGSVSPLALPSPVNTATVPNIFLVLDSALLTTTSHLAMHPAQDNTRTLLLMPDQLQRVLKEMGYQWTTVQFTANVAAQPALPKTNTQQKPQQLQRPSASKARDFGTWYTETVVKGELIEYHDVGGCYVCRPATMTAWNIIQSFMKKRLETIGVEEVYFPLFVSANALRQEESHLEGFKAEVAWVHHQQQQRDEGDGQGSNASSFAIRPTSETIMYPYFSKWIRSHRDLPLKLNQWCNIVRMEFSHPTPFIRAREFLWQEGHTAHTSESEARLQIREILNLYRDVYKELLAIPCVQGTKTPSERFAGGEDTESVEIFVPEAGRGIQAGTSHYLGTRFAEMFKIRFSPSDSTEMQWAHQTSWGLSTRSLGAMVMIHGDDKGLVLPPRVAHIQVVVLPVGLRSKNEDKDQQMRARLTDAVRSVAQALVQKGIRAMTDLREGYTPGWKFSDAELKGIPLRIEIGPKELATDTGNEPQTLRAVRRLDRKVYAVPWSSKEYILCTDTVQRLLDEIHTDMFERASERIEASKRTVTGWLEVTPCLQAKCAVLAPWCGAEECENNVRIISKAESQAANAQVEEDVRAPSMGAKPLCIPFEQPDIPEGTTCIARDCTRRATMWVLWGRSY